MKAGIITFHWATNYGAVLQTYALQETLKALNVDVNIIDYYPYKYKKTVLNAFKTKRLNTIPKRLRDLDKENKIDKFRKKYLLRTEKYYGSNKELKKETFNFDCYLSGSDQVWNESFVQYGEKEKSFSYFLDFVPDDKIIASYAASFGVSHYKKELVLEIKKYLERFDFISVREKSGEKIVEEMGIPLYGIVPDPTLLLKKADYERLLSDISEKNYAFVYMLHSKEKDASQLVKEWKSFGKKILNSATEGIENWLSNIYYSDMVITNSFHGIVFSIIFEKPFVAVLIEGSGMNDRIFTLLNKLELEDRIFNGNTGILTAPVDWENVRYKLDSFRSVGIDYIKEVLNYKKEVKR